MEERFVVFDVETPNCRNDRMSAIGVTVVEAGAVTRQFDTLINPECEFDPFNIRLTGITPAAAARAPTFPQLWTLLEPVFSRGVLAAHNAPFDMGVLSRCLLAYGIEWKPAADYVCTCRMARVCRPDLPNHRLDTVCAALGIPLDHHRAGSDSAAAAAILRSCLAGGASPARFLRTYDLRRCCTAKKERR